MKKEEKNEQWDLKKILITLFFVVVAFLVIIEVKKTFLPNVHVLGLSGETKVVVKKPDVKAPVDVQSVVGDKIEEVKNVKTQKAKPSASKTKQNVAKKKAVVSKKAKESGKSKTKK